MTDHSKDSSEKDKVTQAGETSPAKGKNEEIENVAETSEEVKPAEDVTPEKIEDEVSNTVEDVAEENIYCRGYHKRVSGCRGKR